MIRLKHVALCALALVLTGAVHSASAEDIEVLAAAKKMLASIEPPAEVPSAKPARKPVVSTGKGPYYVDFRARTAASWGHSFVWYGKSSERAVEVAGLTPKGDVAEYMLGYITWVPSETGASYGDLDKDYLLAHYKVYLSEADAKKVFAYIERLKKNSPVWSAEISNCNSFIGDIASFMGLKTPSRWIRPENYINELKSLNSGKQVVRLSEQ